MGLTWLDVVVFGGFLAFVMAVSLYAGRKGQTSEDYFLAGRQLTWPLIGFSLIASNISTEHFVGMAGSAFGRAGLAIASYEWMAAVTLVIVAWWLLPTFLRAGIYTMPEFLEYRYDAGARAIMAIFLMVAYVVVFLATVLYSGSIAVTTIFDIAGVFESQWGMSEENAAYWAMVATVWGIGIITGIYTIYGGLKAVVWSDLIQGAALLLGGALVTVLGFQALGDGNVLAGWRSFTEHNAEKLHTVLPWDHPDVPWVAVFIGGLWIPNLFYWGLNQFITQRTLGARSLAEGQKGIFLAAGIKLIIPFIIVFPGIMAYQLYGDLITDGDSAYPYLIRELLPSSLRGLMFAALCGAVMSSFNSGINSASTIFTVDFYRKYLGRTMTPHQEMNTGRVATAVIMVVACLWAPFISRFEGVFHYIQEIWGFISPGIVAVFLMGIINKRTPASAAKGAMLLGVALYAICRFGGLLIPWEPLVRFNEVAFLHHMALVFLVLVAHMYVVTRLRPLEHEAHMPVSTLDIEPYPHRYLVGGLLIAATAMLYIVFW